MRRISSNKHDSIMSSPSRQPRLIPTASINEPEPPAMPTKPCQPMRSNATWTKSGPEETVSDNEESCTRAEDRQRLYLSTQGHQSILLTHLLSINNLGMIEADGVIGIV